MANVDISLVTLSNTFDEWRTRTNDVISDRNVLRNANYVKDEGNLLVSNGTLRITKSSGGTTFTNDYDALISGTLTSNVMVSVNPTGIGLQVTAATQLNGNVNVAQSLAVTRNVSVSNVLTVSGSSLLANVNVGGYLNVSSFLDVTGNVNAYGNVVVSKNASVTGALTVTNGATVSGNSNFDAGTLFVDSTTDRIGVGTTLPTNTLSVRGTMDFIASGTTDRFAWYTGGSGLIYTGTTTSSNIGWITGGGERVRFDSGGNVLIGTTASTYGGRLVVYGAAANNIVLADVGTGGATSAPRLGSSADNLVFSTAVSGTATERMRITSLGNVAIGTTAPTANLHVVGNGLFTNGMTITGNVVFDTPTFVVDSVNHRVGVGTLTPTAKLHVTGNVYGGSGAVFDLDTEQMVLRTLTNSNKQTIIGYNNSLDYSVLTSVQQGTGYKDLIVTSANTVFKSGTTEIARAAPLGFGIATTLPKAPLHVVGQSAISGTLFTSKVNTPIFEASASANSGLEFNTDRTSTTDISFNDNDAAARGFIRYSHSADTMTLSSAGNVILHSNATEKVRLDTQGNVGIGVTVPTDKLQVTGGNLVVGTTNERLTHEFDTTNRIGRIAAKSAASAATLSLGTTQSGVYKDSIYVDYNGNVAFGNVSALIGSTAGVAANSNVSVRILGDNPALYISDQRAAVRQASIQMETLGGSWTLENNNDFVIKNSLPGGSITTGSFLNLGRTTNPLLLGTNGLERARIDVTGNVAIGRTDPTFKLDLQSTITNLARLYYTDGTYNPRLHITGSSEGITLEETYSSLASNLMFSIAGSEKVRITNTGYLGVGSSTPAYKLDVTNPGAVSARVYNTTSSADANYLATNSVGVAQFGINATGMYNYTASAIPALFYTNATERMRIDAAGLVGIGTNAPTANLHVIGSGILSANVGSSDILTLRNTDTGLDGRASLKFTSDRNTSNSWTMGIDVAGGTNKSFQIRDVSVAGAPIRFTIKSDGNVGLGVQTNPSYKLDIVDTATVSARVYNNASTADAYFIAQNTLGIANFGINATGMYNYTGSAIPALFYTSATERMRIDALGNVGIGTTATSIAKFDVNGTTNNVVMQLQGAGTNFTLRTRAYDGSVSSGIAYRTYLDWNNGTYTNGFIDFYRGTDGTNGALAFGTLNTERMRITGTGTIGIGTNNPGTNVDIQGASTTVDGRIFSTATGGKARWFIRGDTTNMSLESDGTAGTSMLYDNVNGHQAFTYTVGASGNWKLFTAGTERLRIDLTGNVGIGTTTPTLGLQYNNYFGVTSGAVTYWGQDVRPASQLNAGLLSWSTGNVIIGSATATTNVNFVTGGSGGIKAKIDAATGNFGINTLAPAYTLDVNGTASATSVVVGNITLESTGSLTTTSVTTVDLNTYLKTTYRTAKYLIQAVSGTTVHTTEVQLMHDGTTTYMTEYATMKNGANLFTVTSDINVNDVRLRITPASATSTTFKFHRISITA